MVFSAVNVSNNILKRAFEEKVSVSPMKLQKILYFVASEYAKRTGRPLLSEGFQPWRYGPVVRTVYDEFRSFGGGEIRAFGKDAQGKAYMADESKDAALSAALSDVWRVTKPVSAVELSRITHLAGSAWSQHSGSYGYLSDAAVLGDKTYLEPLGLVER
ncbi:MAG TPA: type II toxin-antitoxin system antitoxin SocA domain-containing protein [Microbacterium sp.]|nr:type II toxin-antitoxin system antitoxin SocA domain-containing protein [Microbacterium sp.]